MEKILKCKKNETIYCCPICNSQRIPDDEQPQYGTHAFTIIYNCGTEIDFPIGHDGASYGKTCDGEIERFDMQSFLDKIKENRPKI